ncbi:radical SAM protein [Embleya sp. NPDC001921]
MSTIAADPRPTEPLPPGTLSCPRERYDEVRARVSTAARSSADGATLERLLRRAADMSAYLPASATVCVTSRSALRSRGALAAALKPLGTRAHAGVEPDVDHPGPPPASAVDELWELARGLDEDGRTALEALVRRGTDPMRALATVPPSAFFSAVDTGIITRMRGTRAAGANTRPQLLDATVIVKLTRQCNLRCSYCHDWRAGPDQSMPMPVLAALLHRASGEHGFLRFIWHGGEPLTLRREGILRVLAAQAWLAGDRSRVSNSLQTNGTLLTAELAALFAHFGISCSVSVDGPPEVHDAQRKTVDQRGSWSQVSRGVRVLREHGVLAGVLVVVTPEVIDAGADRLLESVRALGATNIGLLAMRPQSGPGGTVTGASLPVARFCDFLLEVHRARERLGDGLPRVRELDAAIDLLAGGSSRFCELQGGCLGRYFLVEPDGRVAHCDKFVGDDRYTLGNILTHDLSAMRRSPRLRALTAAEDLALERLHGCPWFDKCRGWCPHERYVAAATADAGAGAPTCCGLAPLFEGLAGERVASGAKAPR